VLSGFCREVAKNFPLLIYSASSTTTHSGMTQNSAVLKITDTLHEDVCRVMIISHLFLSERIIFGPRKDEVTRERRRLHNEGLKDLYSSPNIVRVIKSRRMRWAGHVARMGEERVCIGSCWGNRRERDQWGDLGVDGWIILEWIFRRWDVGIWTGLGWPRIETGGGYL